jgi:hypothetical protein
MLGIPEVNLWAGAKEVINSTFKNRRTAVQGANSMSKDWAAGICVLTWLFRFPFNSKVICTAPTNDQVKKIMFGEIAKQFQNLKDHSPWSTNECVLTTEQLTFGPDWYAFGRTTKETHGLTGKFQGFKSPHLLIIISEAQAVEDAIYDQIYGLASGGEPHILEIGNPMSPQGRFWEHCTQPRFGYNVIKLCALDSPNVIEQKEIIPGMANQEFIDSVINDWGKDHPFYYSRVLGEFPQSSADCIIPIEWIMAAVDRELEGNDDLRVAGCDVSKGGTAETVHQELVGRLALPCQAFHKVDINETVGWAKNLIKTDGVKLYGVDEGGLAGIAGFLEEAGLPVARIMFGSAVEDSEDYDNLAAKMYWTLRKAFEPNSQTPISIPNDRILIGQLAGRQYEYTSRGKRKIKLKTKSQNIQESHVMFDRSDALAMAWWMRTRMINSGETAIETGTTDSMELQQTIERAGAYRGDQAEEMVGVGDSDVASGNSHAPDLD